MLGQAVRRAIDAQAGAYVCYLIGGPSWYQTNRPTDQGHVRTTDPLTQAGTAAALRGRPEIRLVDRGTEDEDTVVIVITDRLDINGRDLLRTVKAQGQNRIVLVLSEIDEDNDLLAAVELGVRAVTRRAEASPEGLVETGPQGVHRGRRAAAGPAGPAADPGVPVAACMCWSPRAWTCSACRAGRSRCCAWSRRLRDQGDRGADVLLAAHVKTILHDVTNRFQLRNRSHAVAYAIREGLI